MEQTSTADAISALFAKDTWTVEDYHRAPSTGPHDHRRRPGSAGAAAGGRRGQRLAQGRRRREGGHRPLPALPVRQGRWRPSPRPPTTRNVATSRPCATSTCCSSTRPRRNWSAPRPGGSTRRRSIWSWPRSMPWPAKPTQADKLLRQAGVQGRHDGQVPLRPRAGGGAERLRRARRPTPTTPPWQPIPTSARPCSAWPTTVTSTGTRSRPSSSTRTASPVRPCTPTPC